MKFIKKCAKLGMDLVEVPVALVKDVIDTFKDSASEPNELYIKKKYNDIKKDWTEMKTALDD